MSRLLNQTIGSLTLTAYLGRPKQVPRYMVQCACGSPPINMPLVTIRIKQSCGCLPNPIPTATPEQHTRQVFHRYRHRSHARGTPFDLTQDEFRELTSKPCTYCGSTHKIGLDRRNNTLGYSLANAVPCCAPCNRAKSDMSLAQFQRWVNQLVEHQGHGTQKPHTAP